MQCSAVRRSRDARFEEKELCQAGDFLSLVHVTADDDHEEDMSDGNNTMENITKTCNLNCTTKKIEELQSEISENFTIVLFIGFTLATAISICYSCWRGAKKGWIKWIEL